MKRDRHAGRGVPRRRHPRRRALGQHFLHDQDALDRILHCLAPAESDALVEIGGGTGALTDRLAGKVRQLWVLELDEKLAGLLRRRYRERGGVQVVQGDALRSPLLPPQCQGPDGPLPQPLRLAGNLPYSVSSQILLRVMRAHSGWRDAHFLVQREMAQRLVAQPGQEHWGRLAVAAQLRVQAQVLFDLGPQAFDPPPKVQSSLVRMRPQPHGAGLDPSEENAVMEVARALFVRRRKHLGTALRPLLGQKRLAGLDWPLDAGADSVPIEVLIRAGRLLLEERA